MLKFQRKDVSGDKPTVIAWNTFQTVLTIAKDAVEGVPVPGLKAAIGGVLAIITTIQVRT